MNVAFQRNVGGFVRAAPALAAVQIVAGGAGDGVAQTGLTFDRETFEPVCLSALAAVHVGATLAGSETVQIAIAVEDSADGISWAAYDPGPVATDYAAESFAATGDYVHTRRIQLGGARRYVRINVTATLSAGATDTADLDAVLIVAGADELPIADVIPEGTT